MQCSYYQLQSLSHNRQLTQVTLNRKKQPGLKELWRLDFSPGVGAAATAAFTAAAALAGPAAPGAGSGEEKDMQCFQQRHATAGLNLLTVYFLLVLWLCG